MMIYIRLGCSDVMLSDFVLREVMRKRLKYRAKHAAKVIIKNLAFSFPSRRPQCPAEPVLRAFPPSSPQEELKDTNSRGGREDTDIVDILSRA